MRPHRWNNLPMRAVTGRQLVGSIFVLLIPVLRVSTSTNRNPLRVGVLVDCNRFEVCAGFLIHFQMGTVAEREFAALRAGANVLRLACESEGEKK